MQKSDQTFEFYLLQRTRHNSTGISQQTQREKVEDIKIGKEGRTVSHKTAAINFVARNRPKRQRHARNQLYGRKVEKRGKGRA